VPSPEEKEEKRDRNGEALRRRRQERRLCDEMVVNAFLLGHIRDPYREELQDAIRNRIDSYSMSIVEASSGLMHLEREMYRDVAHMESVEIPDEVFDKTIFLYLMPCTAGTWRENVLVHALHENFAAFRFEGTRYRGGADIYDHGAMKYLTNLTSRLTTNLERFVIRAAVALRPGISRKGKWATINGITKDRQHEDEAEFVEKKASNESANEASVIRAAVQEYRAVLGLANQTEKISELKKRYGTILSPRPTVLCVSGPRARTQGGDEAE
jgi:hypothetical protein